MWWGIRSKEIANALVTNYDCKNCHTQNSVWVKIKSRYITVIWIPFLPLTRRGFSECDHCNFKDKESKFEETRSRALQNLKNNTRFPFWQLSGSLIVLILVPLAFYQSNQHHIKKINYITNPFVGDTFVIKDSISGDYTTLKIQSINGDSICLQRNKHTSKKYIKTHLIDKQENYEPSCFKRFHPELIEEVKSGVIIDVYRPAKQPTETER